MTVGITGHELPTLRLEELAQVPCILQQIGRAVLEHRMYFALEKRFHDIEKLKASTGRALYWQSLPICPLLAITTGVRWRFSQNQGRSALNDKRLISHPSLS